MKIKTLGRSVERLFYLLFMLFGVASGVHAQGPAMTNVSDVVYRANGQVAAGTIVVSWPAFNTADNKPVAAGTLSIAIGAEGTVNFALVPNEGGDPGGTFYKAVYKLTDGTTFTEYWVVPSASPATVAAIRASVVPRQVGAQFVNRQYVDTAVATTHEQVVHRTGSEAIAGVKSFAASPEVPEPASGTAAVNKDYVTSAVSALSDGFVDKGGDTMTGPLTVPDAPAAPGHATSRQYVDLQVADIAAGLSAKLGRLNDTPINLAGVRYASQFATGGATSAQVNAACADLGGGYGHVWLPAPTVTGDISGSLVNKCYVQDFRGTGGMHTAGAPIVYTTTTSNGNWDYMKWTSENVPNATFTMRGFYLDIPTGGKNVTGSKSNYQQMEVLARVATPGQFTAFATDTFKTGTGDAQGVVGVIDTGGGSDAGGDEGNTSFRGAIRQHTAVFTATIASINGNVITYSAPSNEDYLGEGRFLIETSSLAAACTAGTATTVASSATITEGGLADYETCTASGVLDATTNCDGSTCPRFGFALDYDAGNPSRNTSSATLKHVTPITAVASAGTTATLREVWDAFVTGSTNTYKIYRGSRVRSFDTTANTITVSDGTPFTAGRTIELPLDNRMEMQGLQFFGSAEIAGGNAVGIGATNANVTAKGKWNAAFVISGNSSNVLQSAHTLAPERGVYLSGPAPSSAVIGINDTASTASLPIVSYATAGVNYTLGAGFNRWFIGSSSLNVMQIRRDAVAVSIGDSGTAPVVGESLRVVPTGTNKGIVINGNSTGDVLDAQTATVSRFKVAGDGAVTASGTITAAGFAGPVTGNATTATTLQSARNINGISFNGSANITVTANLPANPAACGAGDFVTDIAADGTLTCAPATGGAAGFDAITSGTNTAAAMVVGTGGALSASGSGVIAATTAAALAVNPADCAAKNFATTIAANGNLTCGRPPGQRDFQGATSALVGDATDQTIFTTSLDANDLAAGHCYRVTASHHTGGTASTAFKYTLGTTTILTTTTGSIPVRRTTFYICNNAGVTNAQTTWVATYFFDNSVGHTLITPSPSTEDTTTALTLKLTFNVAGPNTATGNFWLVERL